MLLESHLRTLQTLLSRLAGWVRKLCQIWPACDDALMQDDHLTAAYAAGGNAGVLQDPPHPVARVGVVMTAQPAQHLWQPVSVGGTGIDGPHASATSGNFLLGADVPHHKSPGS